MVVSDVVDVLGVYGKRSLRMVVRLADMHLEIAQREAAQEQQRITGAAIILSIGATLITTGFVLMQVFAMLWFYSQGRNWVEISLGMIGFDVVVGGLLVFAGVQRLRGAYMQETLSQLNKTLAMLTQDEL